MKRFLVWCMLAAPLLSWGQTSNNAAGQTRPVYLRFPEIPPFSIVKAGGTTITNKDLKKNKPTIVILFSVDCEHCMHETQDLTKHIDQFKNAQILMVTRFRYEDMMAFYKGYGIDKYPNIIMGSDSTGRLNFFYQLKFFPGIYIYNHNNKIVYNHEGTTPIDTLVHYIKRN